MKNKNSEYQNVPGKLRPDILIFFVGTCIYALIHTHSHPPFSNNSIIFPHPCPSQPMEQTFSTAWWDFSQNNSETLEWKAIKVCNTLVSWPVLCVVGFVKIPRMTKVIDLFTHYVGQAQINELAGLSSLFQRKMFSFSAHSEESDVTCMYSMYSQTPSELLWVYYTWEHGQFLLESWLHITTACHESCMMRRTCIYFAEVCLPWIARILLPHSTTSMSSLSVNTWHTNTYYL